MTGRDPLGRWRIASREAAAAADAMFAKLVLAVEAGGEPPSPTEADELHRLRCVANEEFALAIGALRRAVPPGHARDTAAPLTPTR